MTYKTLYNDIIFIEGNEEYIESFGFIEYEKGIYNNQLKNLDNVKDQLSTVCKQKGGNAVINFKYGQKSSGLLRSFLFKLDDNVNWYGNGTAVMISEEKYNQIVKQLKSNVKKNITG